MRACFKKIFSMIVFISCCLCLRGFSCIFGTDKSSVSKTAPMLSIVMPVYNVAPYLDEALDSAENQTYKDLEIICVNDGSTDSSLEILESHAKKDSRIRIINQENQGVSKARNVGLRAANGEYIYFFDSDDVLAPHTMEKAIENLEKYNADASEFKHIRFEYNSYVDISKYPYQECPVEVLECAKNQNPFDIIGARPIAVWFRVYKKSFLMDNKLEFKKELRIIEDILFNYLSRARMKKLVRDSNVGYFYRVTRPRSAMTTDFKVLKKRLGGVLAIVRELDLNRGRFKFPKRDEYLLGVMLEWVYKDIAKLKKSSDKSFYARKAYEEIWTNFAERYGVKPSEKDKKQLNDLKRWAKDVVKNRDIKRQGGTVHKNKKSKTLINIFGRVFL